jgi:hypothetical protein
MCWNAVTGDESLLCSRSDCGAVLGQDLPSATGEHGAFALPDESGTRLIAIPGVPGAARVRTALCSDGSSLPVRYERRQLERANANGRQVPSQFDRLGGDVFHVLRGKVEVTASCFLVGTGWISGATVVPVKTDERNRAYGTAVEGRLVASKKRAMVHCFSLGRFEGEGLVVLAEFSRIGKDALASVVLMDGTRVLFGDYPAEFRSEGEDLWRVDDGGKFSAEDFHVVFVVRRGERYALEASWAGTEGNSLALFISGSGNAFSRIIGGYWYRCRNDGGQLPVIHLSFRTARAARPNVRFPATIRHDQARASANLFVSNQQSQFALLAAGRRRAGLPYPNVPRYAAARP